jgi:hypothetical protein
MARLFRFLRLPRDDRKILVKAVVLLWAVRVGLWILPFQQLRDLLSKRRHNPGATNRKDRVLVEKITSSVRRMSRFVPAATCLTQALVVVTLLERAELPAALRIGVARGVSGELEAHAWVESFGNVVIGGNDADLSRFTVLHSVEGS